MTKDELIQDAITHELTTSRDAKEAEKEFSCYQCSEEKECKVAWDAYNIGNGWCLGSK